MKWFWYVANKTELMVDCDGASLLNIAESRLQRSGLSIVQTFVTASSSHDHFHLVVKLKEPMETIERQVWQLFLMDHVYRSVNNLFRALNGTPSPSLLISPDHAWPTLGANCFWREPDAVCECEQKHRGPYLSNCLIGQTLRGFSDAPNNLNLGTNR